MPNMNNSSVYQTCLSRLFFIYPNFAVAQQYKTKTGSANIFSWSICLVGSYNLWNDTKNKQKKPSKI